jgi:hypothetical protein
MKYKIEVRNPVSREWMLIETGAMALNQIRREVAQLKRVYPDYFIRAFDLFNLQMLAFA